MSSGKSNTGTVPTIKDGDHSPLWESGAILRYLAARYAPDNFWPMDLSARSRVDQWAEWSKINVAQSFTVPVFWRVARTPADRQDRAAIQAAVTSLESVLKIADCQLQSNSYIAGSHFTLADIQFGHILYRYFDLPIERAQLTAIGEYCARLSERIPYRDHVAVSYEELIDTL